MERSVAVKAAPPVWSFACPDWKDRLRARRPLVPDLPLNAAPAAKAVAIYDKLRLPDVPGRPALAEAGGEWFRDIIRAAFGSIDVVTGERHVAEIFAMVPKKNSKTTNAAALGLTFMLTNKRPRAEILVVGPTQEVADRTFQQVAGMIESDPEGVLQSKFLVQEHIKTITELRGKSKLKIKTFDMRVLTGSKPVCVIVDELHVMSSFSYASRVIGQIRGGLLPNPESLLVFITTQSDETPAGAFKAELTYARGVRDGLITNNVRMLPVIYEFPREMQLDESKPWRDIANWPMVMPNLGLSITMDRIVADYTQACEKGEEEERRWASQHLNVEIGLAMHADRWIGANYWEGAADESITLEYILAESDVITAGVDGGGLDDLLGLAVLGRNKATREWMLWARAWAQGDVLARRKEIAERLRDFARDGDLVICDGGAAATQDIRELVDIVEKIFKAGKFPEEAGIGLDPYAIAPLIDELAARGIGGDLIKGIGQGTQLSPAVWGLERKLKDGTFWHGGQPLMAWCVGNAKAEQRGNATIITKQAAGKAKIDPLVAAFDAAMLMRLNPQARGISVYATRGALVL